jgi:2'-5' RNA ligase
MDIRKAINKLLTEDHKHDFGCAMLFFDFPQIKDIHNQIDKDDLYVDKEDPSFGLESNPHCTLLFGLHPEVTTEDVTKVIDGHDLDKTFMVSNMSIFDNPKYDVLKFDVGEMIKGHPTLSRINRQLMSFPHTNDFPDYHPHMTIAYLKKGEGQKYVDAFEGTQFNLSPSYAVYSKPDGTEDKIEI